MSTAVKIVVALAAPVAALFIGAPVASAVGFSVDVNGDGKSLDVGSGATTTQEGNASNNPALAVSLFGPASTNATGNASGNVLIAVDGKAEVAGTAENNTIVQVGNKTRITGNTSSQTSVELCGNTLVSAQGTVAISPVAGGIC